MRGDTAHDRAESNWSEVARGRELAALAVSNPVVRHIRKTIRCAERRLKLRLLTSPTQQQRHRGSRVATNLSSPFRRKIGENTADLRRVGKGGSGLSTRSPDRLQGGSIASSEMLRAVARQA